MPASLALMFAALRDDDDDSSAEGSNTAQENGAVAPPAEGNSVTVPAYEDVSTARMDERSVLEAVYGPDFSADTGAWNYPCWRVQVKPPDLDPQKIGSTLQLNLTLNKKYPFVPGKIEMKNVAGLSPDEQQELRKELQERAVELAKDGNVAMMELVQKCEDFLLAHNRDPTMSAWEQMQEREKQEKLKENEANEALDKLMEKDISSRGFEDTSGRVPPAALGSVDVERELLRQQEAIESARKLRSTFGDGVLRRTSSGTADISQEDDFEIDLDYNPAAASASRYETDFIEMGVLGRGGGGEVVKARNRLDGRIYAIKKILLEREDGAMAKYGALQNQKLRREVTTVSRMTHSNIVRYYQAWVEGDGTEDEASGSALLAEEGGGFEPSARQVDVIQEASDEESESSRGFWTSAPDGKNADVSHLSLDDLENEDTKEPGDRTAEVSDSELDIFDNDFGMQSPLMSGLGFQNSLYRSMVRADESSSESDSAELSDWDEDSSVKVGSGVKGRKVLYIQMEFCSTTLRKLIDDRELEKMEENEIWRLIRQILEALAYIHGRKLIHRDLKPGNIFLDGEGNVRLGDFGLATKHREKQDSGEDDEDSEASSLYHAIEDISRLMGGSRSKPSTEQRELFSPETSNANESMTGGVGTTFYRAPEQEGNVKRKKGQTYTDKADIFSLGVVLFEMFTPPFATYMERAENLTRVRGDHCKLSGYSSSMTDDEFRKLSEERFPPAFRERVPENAQRLILWCLSRDARRRPSAEELLKSDLLPQKIELEQRYLSEALQLLTSSQSESYMQILDALFKKPVKDIVALTYDTDIAVKATNVRHSRDGKRSLTPSESLLKAVSSIRSGAVDMLSLSSLAMSDSSLIAATAALKRASNTGKLGKGGKGNLKRATQRTAGVLAMRAASSAAVTGSVDGVHGGDPTVVRNLCQKLRGIFESHGAVWLRSPLLRPRGDTTASNGGGGPAELLNTRGVVLILPEDLTAPFARAIGRGGSATANIKRYDIDRVYHKSLAGGHPREALEATFDIVHEEHSCATEICAETLLVASRVIDFLPSTQSPLPNLGVNGVPWFVRINHTRLAEAILDLCAVPFKETPRRAALAILGRFTAPTVYTFKLFLRNRQLLLDPQQSQTPAKELRHRLDEMMKDAEKNHGLPSEATQRLRRFITSCGFLSPDASQGVEKLKEAVAQLRNACANEKTRHLEPRLLKRFEDAARSLKTLRDVIFALDKFLAPLTRTKASTTNQSSPLFLSIDFGMRQRRKHYHGGVIFQCIVLPDGYLGGSVPDESNEFMISPSGMGVKVGEGGDFTDLVRRNRPPGNFGSSFLNRYTASPIPFCCGIRFSVGKLIELVYVNAVLENETLNISSQNDINQLRRLLGHPLGYSDSVHCVVASIHGMDAASVPERLQVARTLWSAGISAEYLPHSGVMISLLKRIRDDAAAENSNASDWSLQELYGVCALLSIPYVVIVQPHLLRDKNSVRLRQINCESSASHTSTGEIFVSLDDLATTILGHTAGQPETGGDETSEFTSPPQTGITASSRSSIDCIYVDNDSYYGIDREVTKSETPHWKAYLKSIRKVELSAESFIESLGLQGSVAVFAVTDTSFWALRDFGTELMRRERDQSAGRAYTETSDKYPKYKRQLKTLASAIETFMRRQGIWTTKGDGTPGRHGGHHHKGSRDGSGPTTILLYSKSDDRFDVVTLSQPHGHSNGHGSSRRR